MREIKKAVITGATGVVGMSLINELTEQGIKVIVVCHEASKRNSVIPNSTLIKKVYCDLGQYDKLSEIISETCDVFYHFAWKGTYGDSRNDIILQEENIRYTLEAVKQAQILGCKIFIGAGSQSEFGHVEGVLTPYLPCNPDNGYGIAKLTAGKMAALEAQRLGIDFIWCRIISMYGPYDGEYTMVMSTIKKMLNDDHCGFTSGDQDWDYIYSKDAARAFRLSAERGKSGSIYCIGSGRTDKLKNFITKIRDSINNDIDLYFGEVPYYPNQVMHLEADISNLCADTGFTPVYTFEQGIRETVDWARNNMK